MQADYLVVLRAGPSSYPLLEWDEDSGRFMKGQPVTITGPIRLRLGEPVPRDPVMVDYHSLPRPVLSTRLKNVLAPLDLYRAQLVPADVHVKASDVRHYWLLHVYNELACMNLSLSKFTLSRRGSIIGIDKLVLDEDVLREIDLERRLVFRLAESTSVHLFHQSVADRMLALHPEGLSFIRVNAWNDSVGFRP